MRTYTEHELLAAVAEADREADRDARRAFWQGWVFGLLGCAFGFGIAWLAGWLRFGA